MGVDGRKDRTRLTRREIIRASVGASAASLLASRGLAAAPSTPARTPGSARHQTTETPQHGGNLIAAGTGDINFDPSFLIVPSTFVLSQHYGALFNYRGEDPFSPTPELVESFVEDEKTLTVTVRQGVRFHNGRELVAQDVVDNIDRARDETIGHGLGAIFSGSVEGAEVIDQYTARIYYKRVHPVKRDDLASLFLIPKEAMEKIGATPVGSGPFKLESYAPGDKMVATRFDDFWQEGLPYLDQVTVKIIADPAARLANLLAGEVDAVDGLAPSDVARLKDDPNIQLAHPPLGAWYANVLNCSKPPFDNKLVRQALNYSIDREKINQLAYFGLAPATQARYLPEHFWYYEPAATYYTFDLDKAKALLVEAGYPDGFETTIAISEAVLPGSKAMAQIWQQDLEKIGVKLKIEEREQGPFYDDYFAGNYEIQGYGLGDGKIDPATYLAFNSAYRTKDNKARIENLPFFDEYAQLIEEGASSIDPAVRKPIYDRIQMIIAEEGWVIMTAFWPDFSGFSRRVRGYRPTIATGHYLGNVWLAD